MQALRLPGMRQVVDRPDRQLMLDLARLSKKITVKPAELGVLEIESELVTGKATGVSCLVISNGIMVRHAGDDTLRIEVHGLGRIEGATEFTVAETDEHIAGMVVRPGGNSGRLKIRVAGIEVEVSGAGAVLYPEEVSQASVPARRFG